MKRLRAMLAFALFCLAMDIARYWRGVHRFWRIYQETLYGFVITQGQRFDRMCEVKACR